MADFMQNMNDEEKALYLACRELAWKSGDVSANALSLLNRLAAGATQGEKAEALKALSEALSRYYDAEDQWQQQSWEGLKIGDLSWHTCERLHEGQP